MWSFNAAQFEPLDGSSQGKSWVEGWYIGTITKSNFKATQDNTGQYLQLDFAIAQPTPGEVFNIRLNLFNNSQQAVELANKALSAICHATGVQNVSGQEVQDAATPMLHNIPFMLRIAAQTKGNGYNAVEFANAQGAIVGKKGGQVPGLANASPAGMGGMAPQGGAPAGFGAPQPGMAPQGAGGPGFGGGAPQGGFGGPAQGPGPGQMPGAAWSPGGAPQGGAAPQSPGFGGPGAGMAPQQPQGGFGQQPGPGFGGGQPQQQQPQQGFGGQPQQGGFAPQGQPQPGFGAGPGMQQPQQGFQQQPQQQQPQGPGPANWGGAPAAGPWGPR